MFFLPYQRRWIRDTSRLKLMEKSRQIGMTWSAAYRAVRTTATAGNRHDCWVSSRDEVQARLFLEDCRRFANVFYSASISLTDYSIYDGQPNPVSNTSIRFGNGRRIHSLSSNPDAQAGKRGMRILDEFALHPDPRRLYAISYPGITWGGQLEIISTHRGENNFFNHLVNEIRHEGNPKGFSLHTVTLLDAIRQGFLRKLQAKLGPHDPRSCLSEDDYLQFVRNGCPDEETWLQEYMCQPASQKSAFLSHQLIDNAMLPSLYPLPGYDQLMQKSGPLYLGIDLGRTTDRTVFWLLESVNGLCLTRRIETLHDTPFSRQEQLLVDYLRLPGLRRVCIDQSGLGRQFAERAAERHGRSRILGLNLTSNTKLSLAYELRAAFEHHNCFIPVDDHLRHSLRSIRKEYSPTGQLSLTAPRTNEGHGDHFWALALALHATQPGHLSNPAIHLQNATPSKLTFL